MKRLLSLPLMLILILSLLAGCTDSNGTDSTSSTNEVTSAVESEADVSSTVESEVESEASSAVEADTDVSSAAEDSEDVSSIAEDADASAVDENAPVRGVWSDSTYSNEFMNITFTMPENWVYATDEEIANLMGLSVDMMSEAGVEITEEMLDQQTIYDMMTYSATTRANISVMYDNLSKIVGGSVYTEEIYLAALQQQMNSLDMGYNYSDEISTATIGEDTYTVLTGEVEQSGTALDQAYYVRKIGNYMTAIIITVPSGDSFDDILANFS